MQPPQKISVAIVEDDARVREGLGFFINTSPGYECVATYASAEEALRSLRGAGPHVLLLDIHLPGMLGSEAVRVFREKFPSIQVLMLSVYEGRDKVFESICNGACGYLLKKTPPARLLESIRDAHEGGSPMSPEIARQVIALLQKTEQPEKLDRPLNERETRLLKVLAEGYSYQDAADHMNVSVNTVRNYIRSIYEKLHVNSKSEAVSKALRNRLID